MREIIAFFELIQLKSIYPVTHPYHWSERLFHYNDSGLLLRMWMQGHPVLPGLVNT